MWIWGVSVSYSLFPCQDLLILGCSFYSLGFVLLSTLLLETNLCCFWLSIISNLDPLFLSSNNLPVRSDAGWRLEREGWASFMCPMHHPSKVAKKGGYERHGVQDSQYTKNFGSIMPAAAAHFSIVRLFKLIPVGLR